MDKTGAALDKLVAQTREKFREAWLNVEKKGVADWDEGTTPPVSADKIAEAKQYIKDKAEAKRKAIERQEGEEQEREEGEGEEHREGEKDKQGEREGDRPGPENAGDVEMRNAARPDTEDRERSSDIEQFTSGQKPRTRGDAPESPLNDGPPGSPAAKGGKEPKGNIPDDEQLEWSPTPRAAGRKSRTTVPPPTFNREDGGHTTDEDRNVAKAGGSKAKGRASDAVKRPGKRQRVSEEVEDLDDRRNRARAEGNDTESDRAPPRPKTRSVSSAQAKNKGKGKAI
ncbi:hypothetical protein CTheo_8840 [Ceratobasidium theobromae]|uniref:Uncharacterized protein n=1 Tax=Ceratobasidium theobromae TaxID=1582974 RepID=A0A5N5Q7H2_9AGAM|nr:hypothetical protein CTheo_8840 [Ceratobasidium theobromae]